MIEISYTVPALDKILRQHENDILMVMAATMQANRGMMFDAEGGDNGKEKWAPLNWRKGRILQKRGTLRKSFSPMNDGKKPGRSQGSVVRTIGNAVQIGTSLLYAKMMNDGTTKMPGGVLRPVNAKALKIPAPEGVKIEGAKDGFIFRKSVKIPARPMDTMSAEDDEEISQTVMNYVMEILNNG